MLKKWTIFLTVFGLMAFSGIALAVDGEEDPEHDTILSYTYDEVTHFLEWNITSYEFPDACDEPEEGEETTTTTSTTIEGEETGECISGEGSVEGPNGQVNHGMFMKLFNSIYEGKGRGCLVKLFAQSDLGKGDQQVKVSDVEEAVEGTEEVEASEEDEELEPTVLETNCDKGKGKDKADKENRGKNREGSPGKSGDAPGRNK